MKPVCVRKNGFTQILEFKLPGVIGPGSVELYTGKVEEFLETGEIDPAKPVIISGRGPLWLYSALVHVLHPVKTIAIYNPALKSGIIIQDYNSKNIGKALHEDGSIAEPTIEADGKLGLDIRDIGDKYVLSVRMTGRTISPSELQELEKKEFPGGKPYLITGRMPVWLASYLTTRLQHIAPYLAFYDPKLSGYVVTVSHVPSVREGTVITVGQQEKETA